MSSKWSLEEARAFIYPRIAGEILPLTDRLGRELIKHAQQSPDPAADLRDSCAILPSELRVRLERVIDRIFAKFKFLENQPGISRALRETLLEEAVENATQDIRSDLEEELSRLT